VEGFEDGLASVKVEDVGWGYINARDQLVWEPQF
jgi:hypothetical protein